jgi:DNA-binding NtrC family response regulator
MAVIANSLFTSDTRGLVLCIDDDPNILELTKWALEKDGYSVITSSDWRLGLDILKEQAVDLVIIDYEMPEIKGHEVATWIRLAKPTVPIILYSAAPDVPQAARKLTDACISKQADSSLLLSSISDLIMQHRESLDQKQHA